jgi:hypothetical protein
LRHHPRTGRLPSVREVVWITAATPAPGGVRQSALSAARDIACPLGYRMTFGGCLDDGGTVGMDVGRRAESDKDGGGRVHYVSGEGTSPGHFVFYLFLSVSRLTLLSLSTSATMAARDDLHLGWASLARWLPEGPSSSGRRVSDSTTGFGRLRERWGSRTPGWAPCQCASSLLAGRPAVGPAENEEQVCACSWPFFSFHNRVFRLISCAMSVSCTPHLPILRCIGEDE